MAAKPAADLTDADLDAILATPLPGNDSGADTLAGYLGALLRDVWVQGEGFSGKRPFGNSGWQYEVYFPLVKAGWVDGFVDEYNDLDQVDTQVADAVIVRAIDRLISSPRDTTDMYADRLRADRDHAALVVAEQRLARVLQMADAWVALTPKYNDDGRITSSVVRDSIRKTLLP